MEVIRILERINPTLDKLFPDKPTYEEKAIEFLKVWYGHGSRYYSTAKHYGIHHNTVRNIIDDIKNTDIWDTFCDQIGTRVRSFSDNKFLDELFDRFEKEIRRLEWHIKEADKPAEKRRFIELKRKFMNKQLDAVLQVQKHDIQPVDNTPKTTKEKYDKLYKEAQAEYGGDSMTGGKH